MEFSLNQEVFPERGLHSGLLEGIPPEQPQHFVLQLMHVLAFSGVGIIISFQVQQTMDD